MAGSTAGSDASKHSESRRQSAQHYQPFPTPPPKNKGPRQSFGSEDAVPSSVGGSTLHQPHPSSDSSHHTETPLPKQQLIILAFISLCEQTALNSISPYLPEMVAKFPDSSVSQVGFHVGIIASAFAFAQFLTNYFWGWLSDRIGRKPVVLMGTLSTASCFVAFGFSRRLWHAVVIQALMGLVNGNQGVISTCVGEITDKSNQSRAFTYLPVIYGIGGITGPALGGLLSGHFFPAFPYLLPNLFAAALLLVDFFVSIIWLDESLEDTKNRPNLAKRLSNLFSSVWQFMAAPQPTYVRNGKGKNRQETTPLLTDNPAEQDGDDSEEDEEDEDEQDDTFKNTKPVRPVLATLRSALPAKPDPEVSRQLYTRNTILLLVTYTLFQLGNVSFNSLYPIFAQAAEPIGRNLSPQVIGLSLAFAGGATILFQIGIFGRLKDRLGNKITWRASLGLFVVAIILLPFIPYKGPDERHVRKDIFAGFYGEALLYIFLGIVLLIKTIAAVGGLTSALLLITNSAPSHAVLGTLNGLAQTLGAAGRAVGPLVSGSLFSLAFKIHPKGEALPFGLFAGLTAIGFLLSFGIRGDELESEEGDRDDESDDDEDDDEDDLEGDEEQGHRR